MAGAFIENRCERERLGARVPFACLVVLSTAFWKGPDVGPQEIREQPDGCPGDGQVVRFDMWPS